MSNHSGEPDPDMTAKLRRVLAQFHQDPLGELEHLEQLEHLGATGKFPEGKLTDKDEGELAMALGVVDGKVVMEFGKPVAWIGYTPTQARDIAARVVELAEQIDPTPPEEDRDRET